MDFLATCSKFCLFVVTNITFPFLFAPSFCTEGLPSLNIVQL